MKRMRVKSVFIFLGLLLVLVTWGESTLQFKNKPETILIRDFRLPVPLFSKKSAWMQRADNAKVLNISDATILTTYRVLMGHDLDLVNPTEKFHTAIMWFNTNDWSYPIYRASDKKVMIDTCMYDGNSIQLPSVFDNLAVGNPVMVDAPAGAIRPAGPTGDVNADGHLILFNPASNIEWDYWQATVKRNKKCDGVSSSSGMVSNQLFEAGVVTFFDITKDGTSKDGDYSASASGFPLLAGLLIPEDFETNVIQHALKFSIPGPRNLCKKKWCKLKSDYKYPATSTEDVFYNKNINAMISGMRIRLRNQLVDNNGNRINEATFSPATKMVLKALRHYGAYLTDNAGGFGFYAEDVHSGNLNVSSKHLSILMGKSKKEPQGNKTRWQLLIEKVRDELSRIPLAYGTASQADKPSVAAIKHANFEVVDFAIPPENNRSYK